MMIAFLAACGPGGRNNGNGDGGPTVCTPDGTYCDGTDVFQCNGDGSGM